MSVCRQLRAVLPKTRLDPETRRKKFPLLQYRVMRRTKNFKRFLLFFIWCTFRVAPKITTQFVPSTFGSTINPMAFLLHSIAWNSACTFYKFKGKSDADVEKLSRMSHSAISGNALVVAASTLAATASDGVLTQKFLGEPVVLVYQLKSSLPLIILSLSHLTRTPLIVCLSLLNDLFADSLLRLGYARSLRRLGHGAGTRAGCYDHQ